MKTLFLLSFCVASFAASAQSLERSVIGSAGGGATVGANFITWTVGEPVTITAVAGSVILTQGFQQPADAPNAVKTSRNSVFSVYPNPSNNVFTVSHASFAGQCTYIVRDASGRDVLKFKESGTSQTVVKMAGLPSGCYTLEMQPENQNSSVVQIAYIP
jgi:hypothetical protein